MLRWSGNINGKALIGQGILLVALALFLFEVIPLDGYNILRILFALSLFTFMSAFLVIVVTNPWLRISGALLYIILLWSNVVHFRYFGTTMQLGSVLNIDFLPLLTTQILTLMKWHDIYYLFALVTVPFLLINNLVKPRKLRWKTGIVFLLLYCSLVIVQYFAETQSTLQRLRNYGENETRWEIYREMRFGAQSHVGAILQFGFVWTYLLDLYKLQRIPDEIPKIPEQNFSITIPTDLRRNIIAIQVETLDKNVIHHYHNGKEVTPFLNYLAKNYIYLSNVYAQHASGGGTSDAEFSFLTSIYPLTYKGSLGASGLESLPGIPGILENNGFSTHAFHANSGSLFNRKRGLLKLGFSHVTFKEDFNIVNPNRWHTLQDLEFFQQSLEILSSAPQPFFALLITLSSHSPFDFLEPDQYRTSFHDNDKMVKKYLSSINYVDMALEVLIHDILNRFPDAIIMIYGDHTSVLDSPSYSAYEFYGVEPVPVFIIDPQTKTKHTISRPGSTIDLAPTIFDYMQFPIPDFWKGISLFSKDTINKPVLLAGAKYYVTKSGLVRTIADTTLDLAPLYFTNKYLW